MNKSQYLSHRPTLTYDVLDRYIYEAMYVLAAKRGRVIPPLILFIDELRSMYTMKFATNNSLKIMDMIFEVNVLYNKNGEVIKVWG